MPRRYASMHRRIDDTPLDELAAELEPENAPREPEPTPAPDLAPVGEEGVLDNGDGTLTGVESGQQFSGFTPEGDRRQ